MDPKVRNPILSDKFDWDLEEAKKIWCFGPDTTGPNILVNASKQVQYLDKVMDSLLTSFNWVTKEGVLTEEPMRGVRFNIQDGQFHSDPPHRSGTQLVPMARRCFYAAQLTAKPTFQEPVFLVEIQCPESAKGGVYTIIP